MSEVTTGAVSLSAIGAPIAIGAALIGAAYLASKYCVKQHDKMLEEIETANARLKWLNKQTISSPKQMAVEARKLQTMVSNNNVFQQMTIGLTKTQKEILAGTIATEHSPLKTYVPSLLEKMSGNDDVFGVALKEGVKNLALDNFVFVNSIVRDAAAANGFTAEAKVLKQTNTILDAVFSDNQGRRFTAYCKLNSEMSPSLALDLEGFDSKNQECSLKMEEIIKYLQEHGVPFKYKRIRHNQPMGVLRRALQKKSAEKEIQELTTYLQSSSSKGINTIKQ